MRSAEFGLRGVDGVLLVGPVEGVGFGGEPVEIVADQFSCGIVQLQAEEISGADVGHFWEIECGDGAVGSKVHGRVFSSLFRGVEVVDFGGDFHGLEGVVGAVDHRDGIIVIGILHVDGLVGFFGAEVAAGGNHVVVVEMPDERGPGIIEHPLDDAGGGVFISGVGLEHGALAVVGDGLGFALEVVERSGGAVAAIEAVGENVDGGEAFLAGVVIPDVVDGPEMIFGNEALEGFARGDGGAGTGFGVVAMSAAGFLSVSQ